MSSGKPSFPLGIGATLLTAILLLSPLYGQFDTATVLGTVRDETGGVIPGVTITLTNVQTGISQTTVSDDNGNYQFVNVRAGLYRVGAELVGFATAVADRVTVAVNSRQRVDLAMRVGEITDTVEVIGGVALAETDTSDRGQVIASQQIVALPLNARNYSDLSMLSPGVRRSNMNASREGSFNVHGLRSTFNSFMLDGLDNSSYGTSNQGFSNQVVQLPPDAVAEFKVQTNNYSAEFGRSAGAVINAALKSGTNDFHGSVWEFHRNDNLNARGFFGGGEKPFLIRNQFGFTFGGPIRRNQTFFFAAYEGFRERRSSPAFSTLPTLQQRAGILGVAVLDPLSGDVFEDGVIPEDRMAPFARTVLAALPTPNEPGTSNNFKINQSVNTNTDKGDLRFDHTFSEQLTVFGRISQRKMNEATAPTIPGPSGGGGNGFVRVLNQQLASGLTYTVSPTALAEFRFGVSRTKAGKEPVNVGSPSVGELFGLPGFPSGNPRIQGGTPNIPVSGFSQFGQQATNPQWQDPLVFNPRLNYSWISGRHSLKVGYEYQHIRVDIQDVNPLNGLLQFAGAFSRPADVAGPASVFNLADFLFGAPSQIRLVNFFEANMQQRMHFAYLQDDFKVTPNLTLNLGIRYEYGSPLWEKNDRLTNFDPVTNSILFASGGSTEDRALIRPDRNNWGPRLGFAYSFAPRTVLRGGYGVSYVHFNRAGGGNILAINGPQVVIATQAQSPSDENFRTMRGDGNPRDGFPNGFTDPDSFDPLVATFSFMPRDTRTSYVQNWHLTLQREIFQDALLDIAYVGNLGLKLLVFGDFNQALPSPPGQDIPLQDRRPISEFSAISTAFNRAGSNYHALQVKFERRSTRGLYLLNSFTWGHAIDNATGSLENPNGSAANPQNILDLNNDRGPSSYDQRLNNVTSIVWELPFGQGRRHGGDWGSALNAVAGGWQLTAINFMTSGQPVNLRYNPTAPFRVTADLPTWLGGVSFRPNVVGEPKVASGQRTVDNYLNRDTVLVPTDPSSPFGSAGRNSVRSDSFYQLDLGVSKDFGLPREDLRLQFRAELFNALNKTNFQAPNGNRSTGGFGTVRSTFSPREVQFALKFVF